MVRKLLLKALDKYASKWVVLLIDVLLICLSFIVAYTVKFNASFNFDTTSFSYQIPFIILIALISFLLVGSHKGIIRHTGTRDAFNVFIGVTLFSLITFIIVALNKFFGIFPELTIPTSIIIIHYLLATFTLIVSRFIFKAFYEIVSTELDAITNVLIYGAGDSGLISYGALNRDTKNNYEVLGFIDDDKNKVGKKIDRIKVYSRKNK